MAHEEFLGIEKSIAPNAFSGKLTDNLEWRIWSVLNYAVLYRTNDQDKYHMMIIHLDGQAIILFFQLQDKEQDSTARQALSVYLQSEYNFRLDEES